jgi:hypothetical protein
MKKALGISLAWAVSGFGWDGYLCTANCGYAVPHLNMQPTPRYIQVQTAGITLEDTFRALNEQCTATAKTYGLTTGLFVGVLGDVNGTVRQIVAATKENACLQLP